MHTATSVVNNSEAVRNGEKSLGTGGTAGGSFNQLYSTRNFEFIHPLLIGNLREKLVLLRMGSSNISRIYIILLSK